MRILRDEFRPIFYNSISEKFPRAGIYLKSGSYKNFGIPDEPRRVLDVKKMSCAPGIEESDRLSVCEREGESCGTQLAARSGAKNDRAQIPE